MKNLLLSALMLLSISIQSQDLGQKLKGIWSGSDTSYYVVILYDNEQFKVSNFSFAEDNMLEETIIDEGKTYLKTRVYNPKNKWEVFVTYKYYDKNTLLATFEGSVNVTSTYRRHWVMTN